MSPSRLFSTAPLRNRMACGALAGLLLLPAAACATRVDPGLIHDGHTTGNTGLYVRYLGSGGFVLRWKGTTILTAPYFSNHGLAGQACLHNQFTGCLLPMRSDQAQVEKNARLITDDLRAARAILVGHGHYDHLIDLPYLLRCHGDDPLVYGNRDAQCQLESIRQGRAYREFLCASDRPARDGWKTVAINDSFEYRNRTINLRAPIQDSTSACRTLRRELAASLAPELRFYQAFDVGNFRITPLRSHHAPHIAGKDLLASCPGPDLPPRRACEWRQGDTLAFIIDLLDRSGAGEQIVYRIYYQDAAADPAHSQLPLNLPETVRGDQRAHLAILTLAAFEQVQAHPETILRSARPDVLLAGHWEDFFRQYPPPPDSAASPELDEYKASLRAVAGNNPREFLDRARGVLGPTAEIYLPRPFAEYTFEIPAPGQGRAGPVK